MKLRPLLLTAAVLTAAVGGLALVGANAAPAHAPAGSLLLRPPAAAAPDDWTVIHHDAGWTQRQVDAQAAEARAAAQTAAAAPAQNYTPTNFAPDPFGIEARRAANMAAADQADTQMRLDALEQAQRDAEQRAAMDKMRQDCRARTNGALGCG